MTSNKRLKFWAMTLLISLVFFGLLFKAYSSSITEKTEDGSDSDEIFNFVIVQGNTLSSVSNPANPPLKVIRKLPVIITAYSSTPSQTDDTPYITASGTWVREGIVANNLLLFGTKIRIPEIYGDKVFTVEDRMNRKKSDYHVDVWLPDYGQALSFGVMRTHIEILGR